MLKEDEVLDNIRNGVKMKLEDLPLGVGVPAGLLLTSHIDDEIIRDMHEDYLVSQDR